MFQKKSPGLREAIAAAMICGALGATPAVAQTAFASSTKIVFPEVASTASFTTTVTLYNPNGSDVTVGLDYFDARDSDPLKSPLVPGPKPCNDVVVPANGSVAFMLASQCTLGAGTHFGPLVASDNAGVNQIFGYSRTENTASAGFSIEGFPSEDLTSDTTNVIGLRGSTSPAAVYQSNCFVGAQADAITYDMKFFNGGTGTQIGSTVSGALNAFEEIRYLDVFSPGVANAPAATDFSNVRAEFTRTSDGEQQMVAFCTVQDNATFGADFRIAKALVVPSPPPPPPETVVSTVSWNGAMGPLDSVSSYMFLGPQQAVHLDAAGSIYAGASGTFAQNPNNPVDVNINVCYQSVVGGLLTGTVNALGTNVPVHVTQSLSSATAVGSASVSPGDYVVGLCGMGTGPVNRNGNAAGFAVVTQ